MPGPCLPPMTCPGRSLWSDHLVRWLFLESFLFVCLFVFVFIHKCFSCSLTWVTTFSSCDHFLDNRKRLGSFPLTSGRIQVILYNYMQLFPIENRLNILPSFQMIPIMNTPIFKQTSLIWSYILEFWPTQFCGSLLSHMSAKHCSSFFKI